MLLNTKISQTGDDILQRIKMAGQVMFFATIAVISVFTSSAAKMPVHATQEEKIVKEKICFNYDFKKNINYKRDTSGLEKTKFDTGTNESLQDTEAATIQTPQEPVYTYTDVNADKYATVSLNIRNKPDAGGDVTGVLGNGEKVHVTAQCNETGWFKTDRGENAYVSGKYLSDEAPVPKPAVKEEKQSDAHSSQSTITDADFNDIIHAEGTVPVSRLNALNNKLSIIPAGLINSFRNNGWKIIVTNRDIGQFLFDGAKGVCAGTTTETNTMYFANTDHAVDVAVVHEFGHYMDFVITGTSDRGDFYNIYMSEKAALKSAFGFNRSDVSNVMEYYASCLDAYYMDAGKMQQVAPQSYQIILEDLGKI
jgi:hypothetical protein